MRTGELAFRIHVHRVHAWRLVRAGRVPGTKKTKGGHFYFVKCKALTRWINFMKSNGAFRRREMARAYKIGYGLESVADLKHKMVQKRSEKAHWTAYRQSLKNRIKNRREAKNYKNEYSDLFEEFFYDTDDLIRILSELVDWHDCRLKAELIKTSRERLAMLRDLINRWLA